MSNSILNKLGIKMEFDDIQKFLNSIPKDGTSHLNTAKQLETLNWLNSNMSSKLVYRAELYEKNKKLERDNILIDKKSECEEKSDAAKERYARATDEFREASREHAKAEALSNWFKNIKADLLAGIYVMRSSGQAIKSDYNSMPNNGE